MGASCLGVEELPAAVSKLLADCDGLPFAVEEILAAAVSSGELAQDEAGWHVNSEVSTGVPDSIADSVASRLDSLGPEAGNVVVSAAVLGRQFDCALLPAVAGVGEVAVLDALHRARDVQLIEPSPDDGTTIRFRHSLTREAILGAMLPPELASRAAAATDAIVRAHPGLPGTWCELVAELHVLADHPVDAVRLLVTSARRALLQGAISSALATLARCPAAARPAGAATSRCSPSRSTRLCWRPTRWPVTTSCWRRWPTTCSRGWRPPERPAPAGPRPAESREHPPGRRSGGGRGCIWPRPLRSPLSCRTVNCPAGSTRSPRRNALAASNLDEAERLARQALATAEAAGLAGWSAEVALEALEVIGRRERSPQYARRAPCIRAGAGDRRPPGDGHLAHSVAA